MPVILATREAEIQRIGYKASLGKKLVRPPILKNLPGVVVHASYVGGTGRRIKV
jgi:hypothetical protein